MNKKNFGAVIAYVFVMMSFTFISANAQNKDSFSNVKWNGKELTFTAAKEVKVKNVSVFVGDKEIKAVRISNTSGEIKFPNGATALPGSSLMFGRNMVFIVLKGTVVVCSEFEGVDSKPAKARFYLEDDSKVDVNI